ncbi:MFS transporter [Streptomyces sp. NPDC049936]|uniref:MFS transporter n=1 Tax=Streptomyces sp. NPDC049936 TaxID=3365599 RepID=UPI0037A926D4
MIDPELRNRTGAPEWAPVVEGTPRLPWAPLIAMSLTGFIMVVTETVPAGLLPQIGQGLHVSTAGAGQFVTLYAAGAVVAAIPAVSATRTWHRKPLLVGGMLGFVVANAGTAIAPDYLVALVGRFVAGGFSGLLWGMLAGYAHKIVPPTLTGKAVAVATIGTPVALSVGTPLGAFLGSAIGWRWTFIVMSALAVLATIWVVLGVPDASGLPEGKETSLVGVLRGPGTLAVLAVVFTWMLGHNILYTYIEPLLGSTRIEVPVQLVLTVFGVAAVAGTVVIGALVDPHLRRSVLGSLAAFAVAILALTVARNESIAFFAAVVVWGFVFGGAPTLLFTASADAAGENTDTAQSMVATAWNLAILAGGAIGGVLLGARGPRSLLSVALAVTVVAFVVAAHGRKHGFRPGHRHQRFTRP